MEDCGGRRWESLCHFTDLISFNNNARQFKDLSKCCFVGKGIYLKLMKHSCFRDVISQIHSRPRRHFDVFREKIDL